MLKRYFQFDPYNNPDDGYAAETTAEEAAIHPGRVAVVEADEAGLATRAYHAQPAAAGGFFRLECSAALPALVLAAALLNAANHVEVTVGDIVA